MEATFIALAAFPAALEKHYGLFPAEFVHWAPPSWDGVPSEAFTAIEQVCHVRDIEIEGYQLRFRRTLTEVEPALPPSTARRWPNSATTGAVMPHRYWTSFAPRAPRHSHCCAAWTSRSCDAVREFEGYGPVTLRALVHYLCSHDQQHLAGLQWLLGKIEAVAGEYPATVAGRRGAGIAAGALAGATGASWCLGFGSLGPVRTGMTVEQVLRLADWPGMERKQPAGECWYLRYHAGGANFDLMVIKDVVVRIEIQGESTLQTFSGAHVGQHGSRAGQDLWRAPRIEATQV